MARITIAGPPRRPHLGHVFLASWCLAQSPVLIGLISSTISIFLLESSSRKGMNDTCSGFDSALL